MHNLLSTSWRTREVGDTIAIEPEGLKAKENPKYDFQSEVKGLKISGPLEQLQESEGLRISVLIPKAGEDEWPSSRK